MGILVEMISFVVPGKIMDTQGFVELGILVEIISFVVPG